MDIFFNTPGKAHGNDLQTVKSLRSEKKCSNLEVIRKFTVSWIVNRNWLFFYKASTLHWCIVDMCGVEGKRRLCDLNVTSSIPALATRQYALCCWSIAQIS